MFGVYGYCRCFQNEDPSTASRPQSCRKWLKLVQYLPHKSIFLEQQLAGRTLIDEPELGRRVNNCCRQHHLFSAAPITVKSHCSSTRNCTSFLLKYIEDKRCCRLHLLSTQCGRFTALREQQKDHTVSTRSAMRNFEYMPLLSAGKGQGYSTVWAWSSFGRKQQSVRTVCRTIHGLKSVYKKGTLKAANQTPKYWFLPPLLCAMPSEPIEASVFPSVLSKEQDDEFRTLEAENLSLVLSRHSTQLDALHRVQTLHDLEEIHEKEGYLLVAFEKGTGEDPREWGKLKKWYYLLAAVLLRVLLTCLSSGGSPSALPRSAFLSPLGARSSQET